MSDRYQPLSAKKLALIVVLALLTATTVMLSMLARPGKGPPPVRAVAPDAARCAAGQTTGCVGGTATVTVLPASTAASTAP